MSDPKRWSETDDINEDVRQLVTSLSRVEPAAATRESVWAKVAATLPAGPGSGGPSHGGGGGASGGAAGTGTGTTLGIGAKLIGAAALAAAALSIWIVTRPNAPPVAAPAPVTTAASPTAALTATPLLPAAATATPAPDAIGAQPLPPTVIATAAPPSPVTLPKVVPSAPASATSASATSASLTFAADRLREETEGVKRARQLLRDKNATAALAELDRLARLFPNGPLEEEREVLTIEALVSSSSTADLGRRRAERFLAERPQSVHAARVRGLAGH